MAGTRILIIEDEPDIADVLSTILFLHGHETTTAEHGADALERMRGGLRPSIILLDLMMPVMDGQAFLAEIERTPAFRDIPVIVFSGDHGRVLAAHGGSIVARLLKPVEIESLLATIAAHAKKK